MDSTVDDPAYWEEAYRRGDDGWELGAPAPPLVRAVGGLATGSHAVVLGCGRGHEARLVARAGWRRVTAVDFAPTALAEARRLSAGDDAAGCIAWRDQDVFTLGRTDPGVFDLAVEHTCFCAIDPARRTEWVDAVCGALEPGGVFLALFYAHGRPGGPPFATSRAEVEGLVRGPFDVQQIEVPPDSVERRRGEEILVVARRP